MHIWFASAADCYRTLGRSFMWISSTRRLLDRRYDALRQAVAAMEHLGLGSYEDRSLESLRLQVRYQGRVFFIRSLKVEAEHESSWEGCAGSHDRFPSILYAPTFTFKLTSLNGLNQLALSIQAWSDESACRLTDNEVLIGFRAEGWRAQARMSLRRRPKQTLSWKNISYALLEKQENMAARAFDLGGFDATWRLLDGVWLDEVSLQPRATPLRPHSLNVRYWLHNGQLVKVFMRSRSFAGTWHHTERDKIGGITSIRFTLAGPNAASVDVPAREILELLPCRPEYGHYLRP